MMSTTEEWQEEGGKNECLLPSTDATWLTGLQLVLISLTLAGNMMSAG